MAAPAPASDARQAAQQEIRDLRRRITALDSDSLDLILTRARSHYAWQDRPVDEALLHRLYEITSLGATSMNCSPARFLFVTTQEGKDKLKPALKPKNVPKVLNAPVTVIIAQDYAFWERLDYLFPHEDRKPLFRGKDAYVEDTAYRNATLQGCYMMIAARAL
ncbi:MAG: malonic semialdehyde reductase, partial [Salinarimonadaceae bacterium]